MKLTIGMASYNNYTEVWFTIQALRMYQDLSDAEILVVDNFGHEGLKNFVNGWTNGQVRYIEYKEKGGTAAPRDMVFKEAKGDWVFCIDSHVMLVPGALTRLKEWIDTNPECTDLLHGPMLYDDLGIGADAMNDEWRDHMWGTWRGADLNPDKEPYPIPMHGMGLFGCRKDAWLGFYKNHKGFGGEEGYIHAKYRKAGRDVLCLPFLQWNHHFRNGATPYPLTTYDRVHNYTGGLSELGLSLSPVINMFGKDMVDTALNELGISTDRPPYGRKESFDKVSDIIKTNKGWNILEIGTTRTEGNWDGDGYSTPFFARLAKETTSTFTSIDINSQDVCRQILGNYNLLNSVNLIQQDAMVYTPNAPLDFIYLDGWDWNSNSTWSEDCHIEFFKKIEPHLADDCYVLIDDIHDGTTYVGKGRRLIPYLLSRGWEYTYVGGQALLHKTKFKENLVSCVMITYRRMNCVERSISLWTAQTYKNKELIIYNTDSENPVELGESFQGFNIRVINNNTDYEAGEPYNNVGSIRRDALTHAAGEYYICWDDDDIFLPWNIQQCHDRISVDKEIWAWKPETSMWSIGGKIDFAQNAMEASIIVRLSELRKVGFNSHLGGGEHVGWMSAFGNHLKPDHYSIPAYSFNWSDPPEISGHKQSGTIDDPDNFNRHKAGCTDKHTRPIEKIDVSKVIKEYVEFLVNSGHKYPELIDWYIKR